MPVASRLASERRQYIRLDSVFPVQFQLVASDGSALSEWLQGYTHNVSFAGMQLDSTQVSDHCAGLLAGGSASIALKIEIPLAQPGVQATARIAWVLDRRADNGKFSVGLTYSDIPAAGQKRIIRFARVRQIFAPAALGLILLLVLGLGANWYVNMKLAEGNRLLVEQLVQILRESTSAKNKIQQISREKEQLQLNIQALQARIQGIEEERSGLGMRIKEEAQASQERIKQLNDQVAALTREKAGFQEQLIALQHKENAVTEELLRLDQKKALLEKANFDKMYRWLSVHQNPRTGLVMSFEGAEEVQGWAFTYDQALACQAYMQFSDLERAKKILEFYERRAKRSDGLFVNAYYVNDGAPAEYVVHCGPNLWMGMTALHYTSRSKDPRFLRMAEEIARGILRLQDADGGLRGGPQVSWYATEHNLDGYAFFNMLAQITAKEEYSRARERILDWLVRHAYDAPDTPIKRGKGDATIATDTYAWSIAAVGPEKLAALQMNPDKIIEYAQQQCGTQVAFVRDDGQSVQLRGFDFAPQRHAGRGGVVSSEWTAQMIISLRIMSQYYERQGIRTKAQAYQAKADEYLAELCKMIISSPSPTGQGEGCLPYASLEFVDTGHGWMTPKGASTGSVSGTAYTLFAYYNYNPLELRQ